MLDDEVVGVLLVELDEEVEVAEDVDGVVVTLVLVCELLVCASARTNVTVRLTVGVPVAFLTVNV